ncbi:DoxX family membrane protein [Streptomyces griseorubiginosus]|uniref:DoxX family membrane protein n=1 Tax=Streptomyces griseorubiginosus TaxID=67304 RepID=UPI001AD77B9E|nr:DoxX family membrane protein [Streptomyces griseorubiginosus]MBO4256946.1 DoxX family membrane protein [Streptomyces griseorubiginosus]
MPDLVHRSHDIGRVVSRIALAAVFVSGGRHVWQHPEGPAQGAQTFLKRCRRAVPVLDHFSDEQLVRINAAVHVTAGIGLGTGLAPAASAAALAGSLVPTTLAAFPFWTQPEGPQRTHQQGDFLKNLALAGGLLSVVAHAKRRP